MITSAFIILTVIFYEKRCIFRYGKWNTTTASGIFAFAVFFCPDGIQRLFLRITCFFTVLRIKVPIRISSCHIIHGRCNSCLYSCIQCSCIKSHSTTANDSYFSFLYSSSLTGSSHSLELFSPGTSIARCENHSSGAAPCQCLIPVGILMQSPGFISTASLPFS